MTKQDTSVMKGVAIIFMIWVHCFNERLKNVLEYQDFIIGSDNLSYLLTRMTRPVEFYIILSGYGLYFTYKHKKAIGCFSRILKLYELYIFTLLIFVPLAILLGVDGYPGTFVDVITNITGWSTTYNSTIWFLFPYAAMVAIAFPLFKAFDYKPVLTIICSVVLYFVAYITSWINHHGYIALTYTLNEVIRVLNMIFPFLIGASLCKYSSVSIAKVWFVNKQLLLFFSIIVLCALRLSTDFDFMLQLVYSTLLIVLVSSARKPEWLSNLLSFIGKHSTSMWFVHAYFIWYLFDEYPYTLQYPVLIFGVSFIESLIAAIIIDRFYLMINLYVDKMICKRK